jgi:hypothetical protein
MKTFFIVIVMMIFNCTARAQEPKMSGCWDTTAQQGSITYTQKQFDDMVLQILNKAEQHLDLDTADYILIVKLSNSISFNWWRHAIDKKCHEQENELYERFDSTFGLSGVSIVETLDRYLGTDVPNRGLGCHFIKYNLDYGGSFPNETSLFKVIN